MKTIPWQTLAVAVSILFGTHNLFVKRAAGRLPDAWGAFVLEAAAAVAILLAVGAMALVGKAPPVPHDVGGLFIGSGSVLYFWVFRLGAPLSLAVPWVLCGWVMVAAVLGVVTEGEVLTWRHGAGLACALVAIWLLR